MPAAIGNLQQDAVRKDKTVKAAAMVTICSTPHAKLNQKIQENNLARNNSSLSWTTHSEHKQHSQGGNLLKHAIGPKQDK
eukprot:3285421-Amphidinium_carterae.1